MATNYGFQAFTDTGKFQIDGNTINYQVVDRRAAGTSVQGVPTCANNVGHWFSASLYTVTIPFFSADPFYAWCADPGVWVSPYKVTGGPGNWAVQFIASGPCTIQLFAFGNVSPVGSNWGFQVFSDSGALVADALSPFCRVLDWGQTQYGNAIGARGFQGGNRMPPIETQVLSYPTPILVAGALPGRYMYSVGDGSANTGMFVTAWQTNGGQLATELHGYVSNGMNGNNSFIGYTEALYSRWLVLDATGLI
jgi:hypothetical protein